MSKVLIVSDSHGWTSQLLSLKKQYQGEVDAMIHCGDSELGYDQAAITGFKRVAGNTDFDSQFPEELIFDVFETTFFVAHGHKHDIYSTLTQITDHAKESRAKIVCHGHSHLAKATRVGDQLIINPGSIRFPRGRKEETYSILEWDAKGNYTVRFYQLNGVEVKDLAFKTQL